jgi:hypothetical protein
MEKVKSDGTFLRSATVLCSLFLFRSAVVLWFRSGVDGENEKRWSDSLLFRSHLRQTFVAWYTEYNIMHGILFSVTLCVALCNNFCPQVRRCSR